MIPLLKKCLSDLKNEGPLNPLCGICSNIDHMIYVWHNENKMTVDTKVLREISEWMAAQFRVWEKYSGHLGYPIPCPDYCDSAFPDTMYDTARDEGFLWDKQHPYGALRWELLGFLISQSEKMEIEIDFE